MLHEQLETQGGRDVLGVQGVGRAQGGQGAQGLQEVQGVQGGRGMLGAATRLSLPAEVMGQLPACCLHHKNGSPLSTAANFAARVLNDHCPVGSWHAH